MNVHFSPRLTIMENVQPAPSDWSDPGQFLSEIRNLDSYLIKLLIKIEKNSDSASEYLVDHISSCFKQVSRVIDICTMRNAMKSPLFGVFIEEFKNSNSEIIEDLKLKTENYAKEIDFPTVLGLIRSLSDSMENNIFLANETSLITCSILSSSFKTMKSYIKIADVLKDSEKAVAIKKELATLRSEGDGVTSYYASIVGPSFMGKTQTAFILSYHMTVFYVNLLSTFNRGYLGMYPIYKETSNFSILFLRTIKADMKLLEKERVEADANELLRSNLGFETLGLLFVLIYDQKLNPNLSVEERFIRWCNLSKVIVPKLTVRDFKEKLRGNLH
jgi:hypothetical protein